MIDFDYTVMLTLAEHYREVPLTNSFGPLYPRFSDQLLEMILKIPDEAKVVDISGKDTPFARADEVLQSNRSRQKLPFTDKAFDIVVSRQLLQQADAPEALCREMMRIAGRGYIEVPQKAYDLLMGPDPSHNWFISAESDKLIIERRMFIRHPFRHICRSKAFSSPEVKFLLYFELANAVNVQFYWENKFACEIIDPGGGYDYNDPSHAAEAHLDTAICSLLYGGHFPGAIEADARLALKLRPKWALAHNTLGVVLWQQKRFAEAVREFKEALALQDRDEFVYNAQLEHQGQKPLTADFDDELPMDIDFCSTWIGQANIRIHELLENSKIKPKPEQA